METHNVNDPKVYLQKMSRSASIQIAPRERGLWGNIFCMHWMSNWLKIPIWIWSSTQMKSCIHFNSNIDTKIYDILFHDEHPLDGNFEPLLNESQLISSIFDIEKPNNALLQMDKKTKNNLNIKYNLKTKNANVEMNINNVLHNHDLFCLHNFSYSIGDCLFDTFQVLLHFKYTSIELEKIQ